MITIARFDKPEEAHLLRMRLEAGGIPAYVQDENVVQMQWLYSNAIGGVRVQIDDQDFEHAKAILNEQPPEILSADRPHCPSCLSDRTAPDDFPRRISFLSLLVFNFPFLFSKSRWKCASCGKTWNEKGLTNRLR